MPYKAPVPSIPVFVSAPLSYSCPVCPSPSTKKLLSACPSLPLSGVCPNRWEITGRELKNETEGRESENECKRKQVKREKRFQEERKQCVCVFYPKLKMATYTVTLNGSAPWGFRLQGGKDFNMPLTVSRTTPGSKAAGGSLVQGDIITSIDGLSTEGMTHLEAQNKIKMASNKLALTMQKSKRPAPVPMATPRMDSPMSVIPHQKIIANTAGNQEYVPSFNPIALKDSALSTHKPIEVRGPGGKATIVHAQYNTPISMYSQDAIMDAIAGQSQSKGHEGEDVPAGSPLAGSLPMKDPVVDSASPVYQAVIQPHDRDEEMAEWARRAANLQSKSFKMLAHLTGTEYMQDPDEEALQRSRDKFESEVKGPRFRKLKNWHNGLSAQILNVPVTPF
ncbi:LIM domain-binding protein 3 isoform X2 [Coregonus clupeaformis]|uniref:LIM domain-binding protein 3 isoform X2 n=1 Tax=Coregonus clupeaformis TaxID=59861 RepID=UPI001BE12B0A|nr:LIM domain-binding protein 3 isoform X2 [Coregonus clupeaformis]